MDSTASRKREPDVQLSKESANDEDNEIINGEGKISETWKRADPETLASRR